MEKRESRGDMGFYRKVLAGPVAQSVSGREKCS